MPICSCKRCTLPGLHMVAATSQGPVAKRPPINRSMPALLCSFKRYDLSSLRTGIMAGSPCPVAVMRKVQAGAYSGSSEAVCVCVCSCSSRQERVDATPAATCGGAGRATHRGAPAGPPLHCGFHLHSLACKGAHVGRNNLNPLTTLH